MLGAVATLSNRRARPATRPTRRRHARRVEGRSLALAVAARLPYTAAFLLAVGGLLLRLHKTLLRNMEVIPGLACYSLSRRLRPQVTFSHIGRPSDMANK